MDDNEREARLIEEQVRRGAITEKHAAEPTFTELQRDSEEEKGEQSYLAFCPCCPCCHLMKAVGCKI